MDKLDSILHKYIAAFRPVKKGTGIDNLQQALYDHLAGLPSMQMEVKSEAHARKLGRMGRGLDMAVRDALRQQILKEFKGE